MKSYSTGRNQYGVWTKNTDTTALTVGDGYANDDYRAICALKDWPFLERQRALVSVASTQFVPLPYDCDLVREISVVPTGQTTRWVPKLSPSQSHWDTLNLTTFTADQPQWYFVLAGQLGLWPTPASSNNAITVTQKTRVIDLSRPDYTTGNIVSVANGGLTVVGSGTAWTAAMTGRFIQITSTDTANAGDGIWYEIAAVGSSTSITLVRAYGGAAISAGSAAYTIGQMPLLPEAFQDLPWMFAAGMYWAKEADERSAFFMGQHGSLGGAGESASGRIKELIGTYSSPTTDMVIDDGIDREIINPNLVIHL